MFDSPEPPDSSDQSSRSQWEAPINLEHLETLEALEQKILTQAAYLNAANYQFLKLLAEFDEQGGWVGTGIKSFAHWLNWKVGISGVVAREKVRVARALGPLPLISAAFASGAISYSKVRAMTRVATPENESYLMMIAKHGTAAHMELLVRKYRRCKSLESDEALDDEKDDDKDAWKKDASVTWYHDEAGMTVIKARLPMEEGAVVIKALEVLADKIMREQSQDDEKQIEVNAKAAADQDVSAETFQHDPSIAKEKPDWLVNRATALVQMAETAIAMERGERNSGPSHSLGEQYQIMLHVNANTAHIDYKINGSDCCSLEDRDFIQPAVARRIACDASITTILENDEGSVLCIGRRSRIIPRNIGLALKLRDKGCAFPGCCQQKYTDAHHIRHWADGGETSLSNLISLCRHHHQLLHKGVYSINKEEDEVVFTNHRGDVIQRSIYPQFPNEVHNSEPINSQGSDVEVDCTTAMSLWQGETMDIQMALRGLFDME